MATVDYTVQRNADSVLIKTAEKNAEKNAESILVLIAENNKVTINELVKALNRSERWIRNNINQLKQEKRLERIGGRKSGYWQIKDVNETE